MNYTTNQQQFAQSASALGAGILGLGLGAKWGSILSAYALIIILVGAVLHVSGMYLIRIKRHPVQQTKQPGSFGIRHGLA